MMMTAAGTIAPARVLVMGAGVAGLQAIATARRLGAIVSATDVRPATKEQVESLGASFIAVEDEEFKQAETAGGYAKEMSDAYKAKQAALVAEHIKKQDIIITTALIPGRKAPVLVSEDMVKSMKPGSVIVDLAVEQGGNCPLSEVGKVVEKHGVKLGFMSFFVKAAIQALKDFPAVNAEIDGADIVYKNYYDIGVAVSTPTGLVVPVVRDADIKGFAGIEKEIGDLGLRARDGKLSIEDMTGGTFTITNGGVFGSMLSTPSRCSA